MKTNTAIALLTLIMAVSCKKSEGFLFENSFRKISSVQAKYLFTKEEHASFVSIGGTAHFKFEGNSLIERRGGFISIGIFSGVYTTDIYDEARFNSSNAVTIETKDDLDGANIIPSKREVTMDNGLIVKKITHDPIESDTIYYFYDAQKRLKKTEQHFKYAVITREYTFDDRGNLQKITGSRKSLITGAVSNQTEELFGGYDNKPNILKGLGFWQDFHYRSLSNNNFTTYSFTSGSSSEGRTWTLVYDSKGNVDFSQ